MGTADLPEDVRTIIRQHVGSVLELDVLLAMRAAGRAITPDELARELRLNAAACAAALDKFAAAGFLSVNGSSSYQYAPPAGREGARVDALAQAYSQRRVSVVRFIYQRPSPGVSAFADAFKLRKDD